MKLVSGNTYNYHYSCIAEAGENKGKRVEGDILLIFDSIIDAEGFTCDCCGKDLKKGYLFYDTDNGESDPSQYFFGSECVKKVITKL